MPFFFNWKDIKIWFASTEIFKFIISEIWQNIKLIPFCYLIDFRRTKYIFSVATISHEVVHYTKFPYGGGGGEIFSWVDISTAEKEQCVAKKFYMFVLPFFSCSRTVQVWNKRLALQMRSLLFWGAHFPWNRARNSLKKLKYCIHSHKYSMEYIYQKNRRIII